MIKKILYAVVAFAMLSTAVQCSKEHVTVPSDGCRRFPPDPGGC